MGTLLARFHCITFGHDWEWGLRSGHSWCRRCKRYDDYASVQREDRVLAGLRKWSPLGLSLKRRDLSVRVGWYWLASLSTRLHFGFSRQGELPGLNVTLHVWRLCVWVGMGSGWQDEDGDGRSFAGLNVTFTTYRLRWIGCWLGHQWSDPERGYIHCERCDESAATIEPDTRIAA